MDWPCSAISTPAALASWTISRSRLELIGPVSICAAIFSNVESRRASILAWRVILGSSLDMLWNPLPRLSAVVGWWLLWSGEKGDECRPDGVDLNCACNWFRIGRAKPALTQVANLLDGEALENADAMQVGHT